MLKGGQVDRGPKNQSGMSLGALSLEKGALLEGGPAGGGGPGWRRSRCPRWKRGAWVEEG